MLVWELGSGTGHWANLSPVAKCLSVAGHDVFAVLRNVTVGSSLAEFPMTILQAPHYSTPKSKRVQLPHTFVHMLHNIGFNDRSTLSRLVSSWQNLYTLIQPDIVVFEHSPTALLSSLGLPFKKVILGSGFYSPPNVFPIPDLQYWESASLDLLAQEETELMECINDCLDLHGKGHLEQLGLLFNEVDENILLVFEEFDHYGLRPNSEYWGTYSSHEGIAPHWPDSSSLKRVFAYLKMDERLPALLSAVLSSGCHMLAFIPDRPQWLADTFRGEKIHFVDQAVDIKSLATQCDLAILNGNIASATTLLLQGIPCLNIPLQMEQLISARRLADTGASAWCRPDRPQALGGGLITMLEQQSFKDAATAFAKRYQTFDSRKTIEKVVERIAYLI